MDQHRSYLAQKFGLRSIAFFEALKGLLALGVVIWMLTLMHKDKLEVAERFLDALHISPEKHFYQRVMHFAEHVTDRNLWMFILFVFLYSAIRFVEAAGLWLQREWAEWFALVSGSVYLPIEIYELAHRQTPIRWAIFGINVIIVVYLAWLRIELHRTRQAQPTPGTPHVVADD